MADTVARGAHVVPETSWSPAIRQHRWPGLDSYRSGAPPAATSCGRCRTASAAHVGTTPKWPSAPGGANHRHVRRFGEGQSCRPGPAGARRSAQRELTPRCPRARRPRGSFGLLADTPAPVVAASYRVCRLASSMAAGSAPLRWPSGGPLEYAAWRAGERASRGPPRAAFVQGTRRGGGGWGGIAKNGTNPLVLTGSCGTDACVDPRCPLERMVAGRREEFEPGHRYSESMVTSSLGRWTRTPRRCALLVDATASSTASG